MARKRTEPQSRRVKSDVAGLVPGRAPAPDEIKLNAISAQRLASLAGLETNEVQGQTIAAISEQLKWAIDPEWLFFRRVCGRVVKTDPDSGIAYPVPYATVHVLDTDCDFWGYFPEGWLYSLALPDPLPHRGADEGRHRRVRQLLRLDPALRDRLDPALAPRAVLLRGVPRQAVDRRPARPARAGGRDPAEVPAAEPGRPGGARGSRSPSGET